MESKFNNLGQTDLKVSKIGLGGWAFGSDWGEQPVDQSIETIVAAVESGCRFIDTAAGYGKGRSEQVIAKALSRLTADDSVAVATKIHPVMPGPWPPSPYCKIEDRYPVEHLEKLLDTSLKNLRTDAIDLVQLHTWTRAWNKNPVALEWLSEQKRKGKVKWVGVSTPEHDQNSVIDLMRRGLVDSVQLIYNLFEQEPAAELLPVANELGIGVIVRVALDEGSLVGKWTEDHSFASGDFRNQYFGGDRLQRTITRTKRVEKLLKDSGYSLREAALKFVLDHEAVDTVVVGARNKEQAEMNMRVMELPTMDSVLLERLREFNWPKGFWYSGK